MKLIFSFLPVVALCGASMLSGCACHRRTVVVATPVPAYSRVVSSDFEGHWIAEFVAEGEVLKAEKGYRFTAVQRRIFKPTVMEFHYPLGRPVTVIASNVIVTPAAKPLWLERMDRDVPVNIGCPR